MPVGDSNKGISATKGQKYISFQTILTTIDWWHEEIEGENFDHKGALNTFVFMPKLLYGLTNKINLSVAVTLGVRKMHWNSPNESIHHRDESTLSDFINAKGGVLGDTRVVVNNILKNTKKGDGVRLYAGGGLTIPSKSVLTSDPFFLKEGDIKKSHRHFSLSNGTYNGILELQLFYKRNVNPVFVGGFLTLERPLSVSQYGYLPPTVTSLSLSGSFMNYDQRESSIDYGLNLIHNSKAFWNDIYAPNSESFTAIPSVGYLFKSRFGVLSLNLQKPIFLYGAFAGNEGDLKQRSGVWQVSLSLRYIR